MTVEWMSVFVVSFICMEFAAWALHKYAMHGFLWWLHIEHHQPVPGQTFQRNDAFAVFFAVPSFLFILFDHLNQIPILGAIGFGIMAYGFAYFFVHEVIIHRRLKLFNVRNNWYVEAINSAHKIHHSERGKYGCENFGMLVVNPKYFQAAINKRRKVLPPAQT